jgi:peroxiredoxin
MAAVSSTMIPLGTTAPNFLLTDVVSGKKVSLDSFKGKKGLLIMFICAHCPYVQHVKLQLARIGKDYQDQNIAIVAVSSNDASTYPEDSPENLKEMALECGFKFPLCYDETQETARAYGAVCTPDFFLFDENRKLVYRGQMDDSRPGNRKPVTGQDLRKALDAVIQGKAIDFEQKPSLGCSIKWKPENSRKF